MTRALTAVTENTNTQNTFARVVKKVDQIVSNSVTEEDDDELFVDLNASTQYSFELGLWIDSTANADFSYIFNNAQTGRKTSGNTVGAAVVSGGNDLNSTVEPSTGGAAEFIVCHGIILTTIAARLQLQWAQRVLEVSDTKVLKGSYLIVYEALP